MKRIFTVLTASVCLYNMIYAQCIPNTSLTNPGVYPPSDSLACVERTVAYIQDVQVVLPASFGGFVTLNNLTIDTITGFPSGITYTCNPASCVLPGGSVSCIRFSGTTSAAVGTYPLKIVATANTSLGTFGPMDLDSLLAMIPGGTIPPVNYELKVINPGDPCQLQLGVVVSGDTTICPGETNTLTAVVSNGSGSETYMWSTGDNTQSIVVSSTGTYSVTVTDQGNTATATVNVVAGQAPSVGFNFNTSSLTAYFTNTSVDATSYQWDFGDGNTSVMPSPTHTYAAAGTYTVWLIASNGCGEDSTSALVTVQLGPCTANPPTGNAGVFPGPDSIPCIERNVPYDFTMQVENFDTIASVFGFALTMDTVIIDSITNFPCGISWEADKLVYAPGETGCIRVSGTSREITGQYPLKIYMTITLSIPALGSQTFSGELNDLISQLDGLLSTLGAPTLGLDYKYVSRVIESGQSCPARDVNADGVASGDVCPPFTVEITGNPTICSGASTTLTAVAKYETGSVTYLWSDGSTMQSITVSAPGTYSVTATDQNGTVSATVTVGTGTSPSASFTAQVSGPVVTVTNNSSTGGGTTYSWNYGDGTPAVSGQNPPPHTYNANGTYNVVLTVTNSCGTARDTQTVNITGVFVAAVEYDLSFEVFPNPSAGAVNLKLAAGQTATAYAIQIFDLTGKSVYQEALPAVSGRVEKQLDLTGFAKGVYTIRIDSDKGFGVRKLILH
ncbi:MAG: hypothetical protein KatS3mg031_1312 [Chitinophagales bacterium]|nr:MAG: hypothetical protein KatS3mg031_1312 [Chitinophagales bacterium]